MRSRMASVALPALPIAFLLAAVVPAGVAQAGMGEGFFYEHGPKAIPDGHGAARLKLESELPNDIDPILDDVNLSLRVKHPQTHNLIVRLKRPNYIGTAGEFAGPRILTLSDRDTNGKNLGKGGCPDSPPVATPPSFTTFDDAASSAIGAGTAPYEGAFDPIEPLTGFNGYHAAPSTDPASPETWTVTVKDVKSGHTGDLLCAVLYLHRF
jgi:hypothetical protein